MKLVTKLKRKKLKTRKCLNELRKTFLGNSDKECSIHNIHDTEEYFNTKCNTMTMSRLTLGFLRKAVQSDIITRHGLSPIQKESDISKNILDTNETITTCNKSENPCTEMKTSEDHKHDFSHKAPSKSPSLFSSLESDRTIVSCTEGSVSESVENLHLTLNSLTSDRGFVNSHIEKLSSEIIVEENPMTYIKMGFSKEAPSPRSISISSGSSSSSRGGSPRPDSSRDSSDCADDTPQYIYYPHRLNQ